MVQMTFWFMPHFAESHFAESRFAESQFPKTCVIYLFSYRGNADDVKLN